MSTYNLPGKHQVRDAPSSVVADLLRWLPFLSRAMVPNREAHLPKAALRSARVTALIPLGAMNAWAAQTKADYATLSTALCLYVCAAYLFSEDLVQRG